MTTGDPAERSSEDGLWGLASRLGGLRGIEHELFVMSGRWVLLTDEPDVRVMWAVHSQHHGWHAEVLRDRLPELRDLDVDALSVPPEGWVEPLAAAGALSSTSERLRAWFEVLVPSLVAEYESLRSTLDEVATPGLRRWVDHVLLDERSDLVEGQRLCSRYPGGASGPAATPPVS
ncbi:MAG: hypothetical protein ACKO04_16535 [Actinomycetes bacterium]